MAEGYWVIRTYKAGSVGEKSKFWVDARRMPRSEKKLKMDARKAAANDSSAVKTVARLLNANFSKGDYLIGLDYSNEGYRKLTNGIEGYEKMGEAEQAEAARQAAEHELRLCLRRVNYALGKGKGEMKYIGITSDMDGDTGETVRVHHHAVINREAFEAFRSKWKLGGFAYRKLKGQKDYTPIAKYLIDQVRRIPDAKKYIPSRNLVRPQPKDRVAKNGSMLRPPKGAVVVQFDEWRPGKPQYMRYILPEAADRGGTRSGRKNKQRKKE